MDATDLKGPAPERPSLITDYRPVPGVYDEMMDADGRIRQHWQAFLNNLQAMPPDDIARCWETAHRLVRENGVTYNVYGDPQGTSRPWRLDPVPMLIATDDWRRLEQGVIQRARLLNMILADLYGPQRLLSEGWLPPALALGNPNFLRPMHGVGVADNIYLHLLAVDVARAPDGRWWILSDRTQAPSGAGYSLENRVVMARSLAGPFRDAQVQRLASFFQAFSEKLLNITNRDNPRIVLMTPGPFNETYFEHAYLARYLGFPLVESADLTVRDRHVYLKTLNGLQQVDLILRRVDSEYCDPLELRNDSTIGVAGLIDAVRAGNVTVANALGSGILEVEALMSFLPGLCRHMLGEELILPEIATWWCGQQRERDYVINNLDKLAIRPTFATRSILSTQQHVVIGAQVDARARAKLFEQMSRRSYDFIGQELVSLSTAPVWLDGRLQPRPMALRLYAAAVDGSYHVMPGGLCRTADKSDARAVSMQQGDASKDTWVLWDAPVSTFSRLAPPDQEVTLRRSGSDLPSRVADNLFWLGRYAERAEGTIRLFRSLLLRLAGEAGAGEDPATRERLLRILVDLRYMRARTARKAIAGGLVAVEHEMWVLLFDPESTTGLLNLLADLRRTATLVRERLSLDAWRILSVLSEIAGPQQAEQTLETGEALALLHRLLRSLAALSGMQMENMTRSVGWRLFDMGRRAERAGHMAKLLQELTLRGDPGKEGALDLLLELGDSFMTYRTRYMTVPQLSPVVDLLMVDDSNPRSIAFQLAALEDHVARLPRAADRAQLTPDQHLIAGLRNEIRLADVPRLCSVVDRRGVRVTLCRLLERQEIGLFEFSDAIATAYFSHATPVRSPVIVGIQP
jgi:uncharacterized circularly permuted ATP-grasp superfamily protein/uncharacterized alpha-E superfamily protein